MLFKIERSATLVQIEKAIQQKISSFDALFTASMRKSIFRATSHFRNFTGYWEIFHNSVNFEAIFEISSPCCSEIKDLQFYAGQQRVLAQNFEIGCFVYGTRHGTNTEYLDFTIFVFNLTF
jgi:hypothetical protein